MTVISGFPLIYVYNVMYTFFNINFSRINTIDCRKMLISIFTKLKKNNILNYLYFEYFHFNVKKNTSCVCVCE